MYLQLKPIPVVVYKPCSLEKHDVVGERLVGWQDIIEASIFSHA